jgi:hypothetical protein
VLGAVPDQSTNRISIRKRHRQLYSDTPFGDRNRGSDHRIKRRRGHFANVSHHLRWSDPQGTPSLRWSDPAGGTSERRQLSVDPGSIPWVQSGVGPTREIKVNGFSDRALAIALSRPISTPK